MPGLAVHLLGEPTIERAGRAAAPPRGNKAWAVLAYVVLAERPVPRARLAEFLFADAADPLGALRWTLAQLRRAVDTPDALLGDPIQAGLPDDAIVDVLALASGRPDVGLVRGGLLDGVDVACDEVFDAWLLIERRRAALLCESVLRDAALRALATDEPLRGAGLVRRALEFDPFDESAHELLVRCLVRAGDRRGAREHVAACERAFARDLGQPPDERVRRAADEEPPVVARTDGDPAAVAAQLAAGHAAVDSGAVGPGVACLRHACAEARAAGSPRLLATALSALGTVLVHAPRDRDEEGVALLHEALASCSAPDDDAIAATICREIGFVEVQAGRSASASRWLVRATELARDDADRAGILAVRGMALADRAYYDASRSLLQESIDIAAAGGGRRQVAWSLTILSRGLLSCRRIDDARAALDEALEIVAAETWVAFQPFPEALRAEVALHDGDDELACDLLDHAVPLSCRLGDPCWEATALRARGLVDAAHGDTAAALHRMREAVDCAGRISNHYIWIRAHCLETLAAEEVAAARPEAAATDLDELELLAARGDMRELLVRAALLRAALGDPRGLRTARLVGEAIDNPYLRAQLDLRV